MAPERPQPVLGQLLASQLLTPADIVDSGVRTQVVGRSNDVALVKVAGVPLLVAKRGRPDMAQWEQGDTAVERRLLQAVAGRQDDGGPMPPVVAVLKDLLVTRFVGDGSAISERVRDGRLDRARAGALVGTALGSLPHHDLEVAGLPPARPWGLQLLTEAAPRFVAEHPPAAELRAELLAHRELVAALGSLASTWSSTGLVHGDLRWDNCLVDDRGPRVVLVDWESAGYGDPSWDVGCAIAEHLAWGPLGPTAPLPVDGAPPSAAAAVLDAVADEVAALATAYVRVAGDRAREALGCAGGYAAARLVHIAFQWTFWDPEHGMARARQVSAIAEQLLRRPELVTGALTRAGP